MVFQLGVVGCGGNGVGAVRHPWSAGNDERRLKGWASTAFDFVELLSSKT